MAALDWDAVTRKYGHDVPVLGSTMSVIDVGPVDRATGPVLVFLHGNPTSSFLWRKVIAALASRYRCIAIDLIGMGGSGKPAIGYSWTDHRAYLTETLDRLDVGTQPVRLVTHDWGVGLGIEYARTHPLRVAGVAFAEGHLRPLPSWDAFDEGGREFFRRLRDPVDGRREVLDDDVFLTAILPGGMYHQLTIEEARAYREPFPTPASRLPIWAWVTQIPVRGDPAPVHDALSANYEWLAHTSTPRLLLHAHPGAIITTAVARELVADIPVIASVDVGRGLHFLPEDQPENMAAALAAWAIATATVDEGVRGA
ncbi:haloalkane dehalogenase [Microbacterium sp. DT81.1]|uniref:haloalkane dehalogenase n=1 Tax=Microbacterium sp. DT81.1 TaxID=3393413 RepID=UPI003CE6BBB7